MPSAIYARDGDLLVPSPLARGPWAPDAQHGGPVAGALARAIESCSPDGTSRVARLTIELLRPAPLVPLAVEARIVRPGRKVQLVEATMTAGGQDVARAVGLRIRTADVEVPRADGLPLPAGPDGGRPLVAVDEPEAFHSRGVEMRFVSGFFREPGPATVWIRLRHPLVEGEAPSPVQRVAAVSDFGNGVSAVLDFSRHLFINPDLTITLHRLPAGEWTCLDAMTRLGPDGIGAATSTLSDEQGPIGHAVQTLLVDTR